MPNFYETTDAAADTSTAYTLQMRQTAQGALTGSGDHDWYRVNLVAGQTYRIALIGTGTNNVQNPILRLYGADGTSLLATVDSGWTSQNALMTYTATTSGVFYLDASAVTTTDVGQYGIGISDATRPTWDIEMGAGSLDLDSSWSTPGTPVTVTYGFRLSPPPLFTTSIEYTTFSQVFAAEMDSIRAALRLWSDLANVTFVEVNPGGYTDDATILFSNYTDMTSTVGGSTVLPNAAFTAGIYTSGDVFLNTRYVAANNLFSGSGGAHVILHEIGHAIGLNHPDVYVGGVTYANNATFTQDTHQYSVMSYFDESNTGALFERNPLTPMLYDIYELQLLYGANTATRATDTTYGFNSNAGAVYTFSTTAASAFCIWDGGGTDTIDASGFFNNQRIDLNEASFSNIGGWTSNVSIAVGAIIENLIGGIGSDELIGNQVGNVISGGAGNDTLSGGGGDDTLIGGATAAGGYNQINGGAGSDTASYVGTTGVVYADINTNAATINGVLKDVFTSIENLTGGSGADTLVGDALGNRLDGGAGATDDLLFGNDGADTLTGGGHAVGSCNQLFGGAGVDTADYSAETGRVFVDLRAPAGHIDNGSGFVLNDLMNQVENVVGGSNSDILVGTDTDNNVLDGRAGTDVLFGFGGDDTLIGGVANAGEYNQIFGGNGSDTASFAFATTRVYADFNVVAAWVDNGAGTLVLNSVFSEVENLIGGSAADSLVGDAGANVLTGGAGADLLYANGGAGFDASVDTFVYTSFADSNLTAGYDTISNFKTGQDKLDLRAFGITSANVTIASGGGSTSLYANVTGGQIAMVFIGSNAIATGDILFS